MSGNQSGTEINLRASAQLFKLDVQDMISASQRNKPVRSGMPHASSILAPESRFCLRNLVLLATHPEEVERPLSNPWDDQANSIFLHGWAIHKKYQEILLKYGDVVYFNDNPETPELDHTHYDEEKLIKFSPDAIINHYGEIMPVEIKGYNNTTFLDLNEFGKPPLDAHRQVNFYMYLYSCSYGLILVENKDNQKLKVWCIKYDQKLAQPYIDRLISFKVALTDAQKKGQYPKRICKNSAELRAKACSSCEICFTLENKYK